MDGSRNPVARPARVDVAVVGLGPSGATLAGLLAQAGLRVLAVDKAEAVYPQPRAVGFDHDAMRIFQALGVADALAAHVTPFREGIYVGADGRVIRQIRHIEPPYPLTWAPHFSCDQPGVETVLRQALARRPEVTLLTGVEVIDHVDRGDDVRLTLREASAPSAANWTVDARYVVACDGASSPFRRRLGIALEDLHYDEPWIVVDMKVEPDVLERLPQVNVQYCEPLRPCTLVNCPGTHRRWEFMLLPGEPREGALAPERLWRLLERWLKPGEATLWRAAAYRFHALVAERWREGRVLLAGDSAHQTPPFLGQGMCQGLRDAGNLAWKLIAVLRGEAGPALLDSYAAERKPHVIETTRIAKTFGETISERDPARARARDARILADHGGKPQTLIRQNLIPSLQAGLIAELAPLAGQVVPQPEVLTPSGKIALLDDLFGRVWRIVARPVGAAGGALDLEQVRVLAQLATRHGLPLTVLTDDLMDAAYTPEACLVVRELHGQMGDWLAAAGCSGVLIRPDHHAWGGFADLAQAERLLDERGRRLTALAGGLEMHQVA